MSLRRSLALAVVTLGCASTPAAARAQAQAPPVDHAQVVTLARAYVAIARVRDQVQAELADPKNKKDEEQSRLREKLRAEIARVLRENDLTPARYEQLTRLVSTDREWRREFDAAVAQLAPGKDGR